LAFSRRSMSNSRPQTLQLEDRTRLCRKNASPARFVEGYAQSADRSVERIESIRSTGCLLAHTSRDGDPIRLKNPQRLCRGRARSGDQFNPRLVVPDVADGFPQIRHRRFNLAVRPVGQRFKFLQNGLAGIGARDVDQGEECNDKAAKSQWRPTHVDPHTILVIRRVARRRSELASGAVRAGSAGSLRWDGSGNKPGRLVVRRTILGSPRWRFLPW